LRQFAPDADFEIALRSIRVTSSRLARYYLLALDRAANGVIDSHFVSTDDYDSCSVEPVLPRHPRPEEWFEFSIGDNQQWLARLGNLVLLNQRRMPRVGALSFSDRRQTFAASPYELTRMVARLSTWSPQAIDERQSLMAHLGVKLWARYPEKAKDHMLASA